MDEPRRILVAEDRETDFELARREIRKSIPHSEFQRVETREAFLAALAAFRPDLIVTDYSMPAFDGLTVLNLALRQAPGTPVVILTGAINEDTAVECMKAGAADYVIKEHIKRLGPSAASALERRQEQLRRLGVEAALHESDERLRQLAENLDSLLFAFDLDPSGARVSYLSPACERIWGRTREELARDPFSWMEDIVSEDRPAVEAAMRRIRNDGTPVSETRYRTHDSHAGARFIRIKAKPVCGPDGRPTRIVGLSEDVTAQTEAEEAKTRLEGRLAQAQKMETVGRLAGGVAHDFNNLLTVINGYSDLLLKQVDPRDPLHAQVAEIRKAGQRGAELTKQLLALSRKQNAQPKVMDLNQAVGDVEKMLRRLIGEDIALAAVPCRELRRVLADPGQIGQVLMNLAVNSRDAMPHGGRLTIATANIDFGDACADIHPDARPGPYVQLTVSDSGVGMDAATRAHLFEPFFTTKRKGEGTGLGLATVHGVVSQAGGFILVESEPGKGATFQVYLPAVTTASEAHEAAKPDAATPRGTETILLVEDQPELRRLARRVLLSGGYEVLEAGSAEEALAQFERHTGPIHLALTDVVMPGMSGKGLADRLKVLRPEMAVVYISGYSSEEIHQRGITGDRIDFLQKPFSPDSLLEKVRETLNRARGSQRSQDRAV